MALLAWFKVLLIIRLSLPVCADWQYKSRPDLAPPVLNITVSPTSATSSGYIFIAPYSGLNWTSPNAHGPLQAGPYIFTSSGELVWSGFGYITGSVVNFQAAKWNGKDVLFAHEAALNYRRGHGHGHVKILDNHYETIKEVRGANNALLDIHEFHILNEKTALVESYKPTPFDLHSYGAEPASQWIVNAIFQEIEIHSGRLLFEWKSLDHVDPEESVFSVAVLAYGTGHNSSDALDYFHLNSVDRDVEHNYLISGRHTSTIYKINGTSGKIIWRLGGKKSNFKLEKGVEFGLQHHARFMSRSKKGDIEIISLFDNSGAQTKDKAGDYESKSSGKILSLNTETWTASLIQKYPAPDSIFAASQGGIQVLPNGNALVNWGSGGAITEYLANGTVVFHAYLESEALWDNGDVQSYRGFKFNWTGIPHEDPAVVALAHGESTVVYVSWNGDTETDIWRFFAVDRRGKSHFLGETPKAGFETSFYVFSGLGWKEFFTVAYSGGKVLRKSKTVSSEPYIYRYQPGRDDILFGERQYPIQRL